MSKKIWFFPLLLAVSNSFFLKWGKQKLYLCFEYKPVFPHFPPFSSYSEEGIHLPSHKECSPYLWQLKIIFLFITNFLIQTVFWRSWKKKMASKKIYGTIFKYTFKQRYNLNHVLEINILYFPPKIWQTLKAITFKFFLTWHSYLHRRLPVLRKANQPGER